MNDTFYIKIEGLTRHQIESVVGIIECSEEVSSIEILSENEVVTFAELQEKQNEQELTQFYRYRDL